MRRRVTPKKSYWKAHRPRRRGRDRRTAGAAGRGGSARRIDTPYQFDRSSRGPFGAGLEVSACPRRNRSGTDVFYQDHAQRKHAADERLPCSAIGPDRGSLLMSSNSPNAIPISSLCVPKTLSVLMTPRNHLSWRNDRAPVFRRGGLGLAIQVEDPA
jgi:hypothetical protein